MQNLSTDKVKKLPIIDMERGDRKYTEKEEKWLREDVKCEFINSKDPGQMVSFTYGDSKNKHKFIFFHSGQYILPRFIKNYVDNKAKPIWKNKPDGDGGIAKAEVGKDHRFSMREIY